MSRVAVLQISEHTDISSGEASIGLTLAKEDGQTFFLPMSLDQAEIDGLLQFLLTQQPREAPHEQETFEQGGYDAEYGEPPPGLPPEFQPGYSVEGDDFEGGDGVGQF